jgi:heat-inducible transcriptional repressor
MNSPPLNDLTERAREIFRLVVEGYLDSGSPVGSKALAGGGQVNLSPASIRNVLADLEARGLLAAPHTSAGRMPTDTGLRLFVDAMMQVAEPTREERDAIEQRLGEPGPIERALEETSALLSDLSGAAGMVMVPTREPRLAQVSLTALDTHRVLAVLVGEDGQIENRIITLPAEALGTSLEQASNYLTARSSGRTLAEAASTVEAEIASGKSALDEASRMRPSARS